MLIHDFKKKPIISAATLISIIALTLPSLHIDFINTASAEAENEVWATLEVHIRFPNGTIVKFGPIRIRYILLYKTERGEVWVPAEEVPTLRQGNTPSRQRQGTGELHSEQGGVRALHDEAS